VRTADGRSISAAGVVAARTGNNERQPVVPRP
jgi:hypothetical protein